VRRPAGTGLVAPLSLLLVALLVVRLVVEGDAPRRDAISAGLGAVAVAVGASLVPLRRRLAGSTLSFLRAYFLGMLLRVAVLGLIGLLVWRATDWELRAYLVAVALSYPAAMAIEGWLLSREFAQHRAPARTRTGAKP
jgi:hypothetical protein